MKNLQIGKWLAEYGERIALGVALVIMLLLSLWGLLSSGPDLTPDKARQVADDLKRKLRTQPASEQMLRQYLPVRVEEIERNTEGVINAIPAGAINLDKRIGRPGELGGLFRRNPKVLEPVATKGAPVFVVHSRYEVVCERDRKTNQVVCYTWVVQPKPGVKAPELKATPTKPNDPRQQLLQQRLENLAANLLRNGSDGWARRRARTRRAYVTAYGSRWGRRKRTGRIRCCGRCPERECRDPV
jgi:hypothetical protein